MRFDVALNNGISLEISSKIIRNTPFPTASIAKGWLLLNNGKDLSEEAVGFGVPIVKRGLQAIFPGEIELFLGGGVDQCKFSARYTLNLVEKINHSTSPINSRLITSTKNILAGMIRQFPGIRTQLTGISNQMRDRFGWQTVYEPAGFSTHLTMNYTIDSESGRLEVELIDKQFSPEQVSEVIVMNEQGAHYFDSYHRDDGFSQHGAEIGCWDEVTAERAEFISDAEKLSFSLHQVEGAKLFRGRELVGDRLAWSGFGYSFSPKLERFKYQIILRKLL
jgi:hypothetical protein